MKSNWSDKIDKIKNIVASWRERDLSLFGKIQVMKTFIISQFVLPASLLTVPPKIVKQIENVLYEFLWGAKDKIKRLKVIQELKHGGLNMVDLTCLFMSFKAVWITRLLNCDPAIHSLAQVANLYYKPFLESNSSLIFNFDDSVHFPDLGNLSQFYKEVLTAFNNTFTTDIEGFKENIAEQCIWGNKFLCVRKRNYKCVLFLRNWIRSGVNRIGDLRFVDGKLDTNFMFQIIRQRRNILSEILIVREALLPYQESLRSLQNFNPSCDQLCNLSKSKPFYVMLRNKIRNIEDCRTKFLAPYCSSTDAIHVYTRKVVSEKEIKLKEFNFKVLHGILACNVNLKRWKIKETDECDVCRLPQTIEHLLFTCGYAAPLWQIVDSVFDINVSFETILGVDDFCEYDNIVTLVCFLIYKEWLVLSLENKSRRNNIMSQYYVTVF